MASVTTHPQVRRTTVGAAALLSASMCFQGGAAVAVPAFATFGPPATSGWRFLLAAGLLLIVTRPRPTGHSRRYWLGTVALGAAIAVMTGASYITLSLIPQGPATSLELLGPLAVGVVGSRRPRHLVAAGLAGLGVLSLGGATGQIPVAGLLSGLVTAAAFACYVLIQARTGTPDLQRLSLAFVVAAVIDLPLSLPTAGSMSTGVALRLLVSAAVGVAAAYSLDAFAIHRLGARQAGIMLTLDPAVGALSGLILLGQRLSPTTLVGMLLVMAAGIVAAETAGTNDPARYRGNETRETP